MRLPLIRIEQIDGPPIEADRYDWVLVTSRNAVEPLLRRLQGLPGRIASIGPGTAEALRAHGIEPSLVAERSTQEGLVEELPKPPGRVLFAAAEGARDVLVRDLGAELVAALPHRRAGGLRSFPDADLVVLASASAARALAALLTRPPLREHRTGDLGEARDAGLDVVAEAESHDLDGLVAGR